EAATYRSALYGFASAGSLAVLEGWRYSVFPAGTANDPPCEVDSSVIPGRTTGSCSLFVASREGGGGASGGGCGCVRAAGGGGRSCAGRCGRRVAFVRPGA